VAAPAEPGPKAPRPAPAKRPAPAEPAATAEQPAPAVKPAAAPTAKEDDLAMLEALRKARQKARGRME